MKEVIANFHDTIKILKSDRQLILLALIPIMIGVVLYGWMGHWVFDDLLSYLQGFLENKIESNGLLKVFSALFIIILSAGFYVLVSWTFLMVVSLFASPINDLMARRVEKLYLEKPLPAIGEALGTLWKEIWFTIINESKKIIFIIFISILSLIIGFFFPPLALLISALLISFSLVDYVWSVHNLSLNSCLKDFRQHIYVYSLSGLFFFLWISIPIFNLLVLPFGVTYFTLLFVKKRNPHGIN